MTHHFQLCLTGAKLDNTTDSQLGWAESDVHLSCSHNLGQAWAFPQCGEDFCFQKGMFA